MKKCLYCFDSSCVCSASNRYFLRIYLANSSHIRRDCFSLRSKALIATSESSIFLISGFSRRPLDGDFGIACWTRVGFVGLLIVSGVFILPLAFDEATELFEVSVLN